MIQTAIRPSDSRLATAWAIIESRESVPRLIVVTGATHLDATQPVARALCDASHEAGKRTAYLNLGASERYGDRVSSGLGSGVVDLLLPKGNSQRQAFDAGLLEWQSAFDAIIVDVPEFSGTAASAHIARIADAAIVALFADRRITTADRDLKSVLAQLATPILGVVCTSRREGTSGARETQLALAPAPLYPVRQQ